MIKNQLYPYIEQYINSYLYGFTKEQLDVGIMKGEIKFESLNLRPDGVNEVLDKTNNPFWLKAGLISKINLKCSLMNFIGEKPIEANIDGINIILTPSYKWIIQNIDNFLFEDLKEMKMEYSASDNNSINIFGKKINVLDNTVFRKEKLEEFFKDKSKISELLNNIFIDCFEFFYSKNYSLILKLKNIHIRFEDDQLINYTGNIAFGIKVDLFDFTLSSEGTNKKNNFKITNLDLYWENNANILIPNNILYDSIKNGCLNDNYYTNLKQIKFQDFTYKKNDTKFIINNLNCFCNFGTKAITQGKIDIFGKKDNNYKLYIQFASNEIKINFFPNLFSIKNNFQKFMKDFTIISQAQEFKPMKKPYNIKNQNFVEIMTQINKNKNSKLATKFTYKKKMIVRDWLFYFYWCYKCKMSIYNFGSNPLRAEFSRFFNIYHKNELDKINDLDQNKNQDNANKKEQDTWCREKPNPDKINLSLNIDIKIKGINLNLFSPISSNKDINNDYISIKISNPDMKLILCQEKFEINFNIKNIILTPNKLKSGEKLLISNNTNNNTINKKTELSLNINTEPNSVNIKQRNRNNILNTYSNYLTANDIESNIGITGFMKKYNPNYSRQLKVIDKAMENINKSNNQQSHNSSFNQSNNQENISNNNYYTNRDSITRGNFSKNIMKTYEAIPSLQKLELNRQKNEFNISQAINHYNIAKSQSKLNNTEFNIKNNIPKPENKHISNTARTSQKNKIISTGKILPLNLLEINSNNLNNDTEKSNTPCLSIKYLKTNNNNNVDILKIFFGIIRINLFADYIIECSNILNEYNINKSIIKRDEKNILKLDKNVYILKKYILQKIEKMPNSSTNPLIKNYINYLKNELDKGKFLHQEESSELNYIFTYFSKGIEINFDFDNIECIYYNNKNNKFSGKALIPSPHFNFKINKSNICLKLYEFDLEFNDLNNANVLFKTMKNIFEDKLKFTKILIEPCLQKIKKNLEEKENKDKDEDLSTDELINDRNELENNLNRIINNNIKPSNDSKVKVKTNKILSENKIQNDINNNKIQNNDEIKQAKKKEENKEIKENKDIKEKDEIKKDKKMEENKETEDNKKIKELKDNLKGQPMIITQKEISNEIKEETKTNNIRDTLDSNNINNIIIPKENSLIPYEITEIEKKHKLSHKKIVNREKKNSNKNLPSKNEHSNKTNKTNNINSNKTKDTKENPKTKVIKKNLNNNMHLDKKGNDNISSIKVFVPSKKAVFHNIKKVPLKIDKKTNKNNNTDNNINNNI